MGVARSASVTGPGLVPTASSAHTLPSWPVVHRQVLTVDRLESVITPPKSRFVYVNVMTLLAALAQAALLLQVRATEPADLSLP